MLQVVARSEASFGRKGSGIDLCVENTARRKPRPMLTHQFPELILISTPTFPPRALHTVYTTKTYAGQKQYGEKFKSIEYFVRQHLMGAADKSCDHWHDDAGIMSHHMAYVSPPSKNNAS